MYYNIIGQMPEGRAALLIPNKQEGDMLKGDGINKP
jgi:hypothetical protein